MIREYRPRVCCAHRWQSWAAGQQVCQRCGARCRRDARGVIVEYDAGGPEVRS